MIRNSKYSSIDGSLIDVEMNHPEFGWIPFTASANDVEVYGRVVHALALTAEYGPIAPYEGPTEEEMLEQQMRARRDSLLSEVDAISTNPLIWNGMSEEQQQAWADYRKDLLDVPQQEGFPEDIEWPEPPK